MADTDNDVDEYVLLQCVYSQEHKKLKVKMMSSYPYIRNYYCQFPTAVRQEKMYYVVKSKHISLSQNSNSKPFYSVKSKNYIEFMSFDKKAIDTFIDGNVVDLIRKVKIYGEDENNECIICFSEEKNIVFISCGHYVCCNNCAIECTKNNNKCPVCRKTVTHLVNRSDIS